MVMRPNLLGESQRRLLRGGSGVSHMCRASLVLSAGRKVWIHCRRTDFLEVKVLVRLHTVNGTSR